MTTPADIRRALARIITAAEVAQARLEHATASLALRTADGHPTTASGRGDNGPRGSSSLTPTEAAANTNLGDLYGYTDTHYRPGPTTQLADLLDELQAALKSLTRAHTTLGDCGVPPLVTRHYQCPGINATGCPDWSDPNRPDRLCIDCGRASDSNRRRLRKHKAS